MDHVTIISVQLEGDATIKIGTDGFGKLSDVFLLTHWIPPTEYVPSAHTLHRLAPSSSVYFPSSLSQDSQTFDPTTLANFPLSQLLQPVAPFGDVFPGGHGLHTSRESVLMVPSSQGLELVHCISSLHPLFTQPSATCSCEAPPTPTMKVASGSLQ